MVCLGNRDHSVVFETATKYCILDYSVDYESYSISSKWFLPTVVDIMVIWNVSVRSCHLLFDHLQFTLIQGPNIPGSYAILFLQHQTFTTRHIHNWALFSPWHGLFIPSGAISLIFCSSIFSAYQPEGLIFQCHIFLPFHTVHGVLKARILKWFAIRFSSGPHFVRTLHNDPSVLDGPTQHGS